MYERHRVADAREISNQLVTFVRVIALYERRTREDSEKFDYNNYKNNYCFEKLVVRR